MARELDRGGQVYVVHNASRRGETDRRADPAPRRRARASAPRTADAPARSWDNHMRPSWRELDVLCSTMIVESGLDVPNANTMIVHDAHQRGSRTLPVARPGRRSPSPRPLLPDRARRHRPHRRARLMTLAHHTELGAGYRIALKDLELRGAGNILGAAVGLRHVGRRGHVTALLEETVRALKGETDAAQGAPPEGAARALRVPAGHVRGRRRGQLDPVPAAGAQPVARRD